ncbi:CBS domain-containing protein [Streptomyces sp. NPDC047928]|uniref:CBS domain-containing protein n=1 Tax=unclassified Streptomyces TaxID=2593676 RepID=UPI003722EF3F
MKPSTVGEVMTRQVVQARPDTPLEELAELLAAHRIRGIPVVDGDDKVVGVVSKTDLTRHRTATTAADDDPAGPGPAAATAADLMSSPAVTVHPEQRVEDAARIMERRRIARLPVVDEEDRLIGITTRRDLLSVFLRSDDEIRAEVTEQVVPRTLTVPPPGGVRVSVRDGLVTLEGSLAHGSEAAALIGATWRVDGVVGVVNRLAARPEDTPGER